METVKIGEGIEVLASAACVLISRYVPEGVEITVHEVSKESVHLSFVVEKSLGVTHEYPVPRAIGTVGPGARVLVEVGGAYIEGITS